MLMLWSRPKETNGGETLTANQSIGMRCMCASFGIRRPLTIDEPFLFVVERNGLKEPLFSAYLDTDGWVERK
jgi:hypothetical protein